MKKSAFRNSARKGSKLIFKIVQVWSCTTADLRPKRTSWPWSWWKVTSASVWTTEQDWWICLVSPPLTTESGTRWNCSWAPLPSDWSSTVTATDCGRPEASVPPEVDPPAANTWNLPVRSTSAESNPPVRPEPRSRASATPTRAFKDASAGWMSTGSSWAWRMPGSPRTSVRNADGITRAHHRTIRPVWNPPFVIRFDVNAIRRWNICGIQSQFLFLFTVHQVGTDSFRCDCVQPPCTRPEFTTPDYRSALSTLSGLGVTSASSADPPTDLLHLSPLQVISFA